MPRLWARVDAGRSACDGLILPSLAWIRWIQRASPFWGVRRPSVNGLVAQACGSLAAAASRPHVPARAYARPRGAGIMFRLLTADLSYAAHLYYYIYRGYERESVLGVDKDLGEAYHSREAKNTGGADVYRSEAGKADI